MAGPVVRANRAVPGIDPVHRGRTWHRSCHQPTADELRLSLVIPAYNEASRLSSNSTSLNAAVGSGLIDASETELILVDDGSSDETASVAVEVFGPAFPHFRVLRLDANAGKGFALRAGIASAAAPVVAFLDADMAVEPTFLPGLLDSLEGAEVAIGSRTVAGSQVERTGLRRKLMGRTFSRMANAIIDVRIRDTQCGFKAFRTPTARVLFHLMVSARFAFDVEILYMARRLGMPIAEIPVRWSDVSGSTVRTMADPVSMLLDLARFRSGRRWPHVPALAVHVDNKGHGARHLADVLDVVPPMLPVLPVAPDRVLILFPLCQKAEIDAAAAAITASAPAGTTVLERSISFAGLQELAAAGWTSARDLGTEAGGVSMASPAGPVAGTHPSDRTATTGAAALEGARRTRPVAPGIT